MSILSTALTAHDTHADPNGSADTSIATKGRRARFVVRSSREELVEAMAVEHLSTRYGRVTGFPRLKMTGS